VVSQSLERLSCPEAGRRLGVGRMTASFRRCAWANNSESRLRRSNRCCATASGSTRTALASPSAVLTRGEEMHSARVIVALIEARGVWPVESAQSNREKQP